MEIGLGVLRWSPPMFWAATPHELYAAADGYVESHGGKQTKPKRRDLKRLVDQAPLRSKSIRGKGEDASGALTEWRDKVKGE